MLCFSSATQTVKAPAETQPLGRNLPKSLFPSHFFEQLLFTRRRNRRLILFRTSETLTKKEPDSEGVLLSYFSHKSFFFFFFHSHQVLRPPATFLLAADGIYLTCSINIICGERPFISLSASAGGLQTFPRWISPASTQKGCKKKKKHVEGPYVPSLDLPDPLLHPPPPITIASLAHLL